MTPDGDPPVDHPARVAAPVDRLAKRVVAQRVVTALACLLVFFALVAPSEVSHLTPAAFLRIPLEGLLAVAVVLALPPRARRVTALAIGVALGLLGVVKIVGLGFSAVLDRPFDPVFDAAFVEAAVVFLKQSIGGPAAIGAIAAAVVLAITVLVLVILSFLRLTRLVVAHRANSARAIALLTVAWITFVVPSVQIVPDVPVAAQDYWNRLLQVHASLQDSEEFAAESAVDAFRDTPGEELLTALRGKDVILAFVESYGRIAIDDPELAQQIGALLDSGNSRLRSAGFTSRSAFLSSPTAGGGSWLAQATLLSGLWIDNQQRYLKLLAGERLTITGAFQRADWRTVAVMPGTRAAWPEGAFFDYDRIYTGGDLGYQGPRFSFASMPDQYTLSIFQRSERAALNRGPIMAAIPLVSSHGPWEPVPQLIDWDKVGDGSAFVANGTGDPSQLLLGRDRALARANYRKAINYSLETLIAYIENYGGDDLVLVFLGDHQPSPVVTGSSASRDVPVTIVARDPAIFERISGWGWQEGLKPGPQAPVWRMDTFRDRFLTAFK